MQESFTCPPMQEGPIEVQEVGFEPTCKSLLLRLGA